MSRFSVQSYFSNWFKKPLKIRVLHISAGLFASAALGCLLFFGYIALIVMPNLPSLDTLVDYRPKIPLRVFTADNVLIGEFGEERRDFVPIGEMPDIMKQAIIAVEDSSFYEHNGVDFIGVVRAG